MGWFLGYYKTTNYICNRNGDELKQQQSEYIDTSKQRKRRPGESSGVQPTPTDKRESNDGNEDCHLKNKNPNRQQVSQSGLR